MPSSSPSYGDRKRDDADVRYDIATPFNPRGNDAEILLFDEGETVEVIIHRLPDPANYHMNYPDPDSEELNPDPTEDQIRDNTVAHWIVEETLELLSDYEPERSSYTTNSGNRHLNDVYFTCDRSEINEAVLRARELLHTLEKKRFKHQQERQGPIGRSPERDLDNH